MTGMKAGLSSVIVLACPWHIVMFVLTISWIVSKTMRLSQLLFFFGFFGTLEAHNAKNIASQRESESPRRMRAELERQCKN